MPLEMHMSSEAKKIPAYPYAEWASKAPSELVCELNRLASERDAAKAQCDKHLTSALAYSLQRDAAVEALIGVQGLAAYMGWNLGDLGVKIAATICATPTPAPTVNAELLAVVERDPHQPECWCVHIGERTSGRRYHVTRGTSEHALIARWTTFKDRDIADAVANALNARAAIAKAEKGGAS